MKYLNLLAGSTAPGDKDWGYTPYIFITIGNTIWPLAWIFVNEHKINFAQATMIRGITCIVVNYIVCMCLDIPADFKNPTTFRYLTLRSTLMAIHSFCFAISQFILPLPIVHTISCSGTLFIFMIDYLLNDMKINAKQAVGIGIGFVGALLATNGKLITKWIDPDYQYHSKFQNYITNDPKIMALFSIVFLIAMALWAFGIVITKRAKANTFQINLILGWALLFSGSMAYPFLESTATKTELLIAIFVTGLPMVFGQWFYIGSLTMTKHTGILNMMNFFTIFIGYLISIIRYRETPNLIASIGIVFVFIGVWKTVFNKQPIPQSK